MNLNSMKSWLSLCLVLVGPYLSAAEHEKPVRIPDSGLEQAIRNELSKTDGDITRHDLASLRVLDGGGKNLFSTEGLEHAINLVSLDLRFNQLTNLHLPQGTLALTNLDLGSNLLKEAAFLNRMPELQHQFVGEPHRPNRAFGGSQRFARREPFWESNYAIERA